MKPHYMKQAIPVQGVHMLSTEKTTTAAWTCYYLKDTFKNGY